MESPAQSLLDVEAIYGGHRPDGLYVFGPEGMACVLGKLIDELIAESLCRVTGSTRDGLRRAQVRQQADYLRSKYDVSELQAREAARRQMRSGHPFFARPVKPKNSGRKRRAA